MTEKEAAIDINNPPPSKVLEGEHWVHSTYRAARGWPELGGKWLIYPHRGDHQLDEYWQIVRVATEGGLLGYHSMASTAYHIRICNWKFGVIMVSTYDCNDKEDVFRVRNALTKLGFTQTLYYKKDVDSNAGISTANGFEAISLYQA